MQGPPQANIKSLRHGASRVNPISPLPLACAPVRPRRLLHLVAILAAGAGLAACGGGGALPDRARAYSAADSALRAADYDRAINGFAGLGSYRDAPRRLADARHIAGGALLAIARAKLRVGHPQAAVALARTATTKYGYRTPAALAFLAGAERAQTRHHARQQVLRRQGKPAG